MRSASAETGLANVVRRTVSWLRLAARRRPALAGVLVRALHGGTVGGARRGVAPGRRPAHRKIEDRAHPGTVLPLPSHQPGRSACDGSVLEAGVCGTVLSGLFKKGRRGGC